MDRVGLKVKRSGDQDHDLPRLLHRSVQPFPYSSLSSARSTMRAFRQRMRFKTSRLLDHLSGGDISSRGKTTANHARTDGESSYGLRTATVFTGFPACSRELPRYSGPRGSWSMDFASLKKRNTGFPNLAAVNPLSVRAYRTAGGLESIKVLSTRPWISIRSSFWERTWGLLNPGHVGVARSESIPARRALP